MGAHVTYPNPILALPILRHAVPTFPGPGSHTDHVYVVEIEGDDGDMPSEASPRHALTKPLVTPYGRKGDTRVGRVDMIVLRRQCRRLSTPTIREMDKVSCGQ